MNLIERTYQARGKDVHLQEVADLAAVRTSEEGPRIGKKPSTVERLTADAAPPEALPQMRAFESAGWKFVPRDQAPRGARVYLRRGGRVALGTERLTVRVVDRHSAHEARALLEARGFAVAEQLKFATNLFVVSVPAGEDPVAAAARLSALADIEFAEPVLIEPISGR